MERTIHNRRTSARIVVPVGEYAVSAAPNILTTSGLGSCVGVAIYEARLQAGGLAHIASPDKGGLGMQPTGHADIAVPAMVADLEAMGGVRTFMVAKLAGGGEMFGFEVTDMMDIGKRNLYAVRDVLAGEMVRIVAEDVRGNRPRSMVFDLASGEIVLESLGETYRLMP